MKKSPILWDAFDVSDFSAWCFQPCVVYQNLPLDDHLALWPNFKPTGSAEQTSGNLFQTSQNWLRILDTSKKGTLFTAYAGFVAGALGGGAATYSTHWLDTIKVKMQTFPTQHPGGYNCLKLTFKEEGMRGLYKGAAPAVVGQMCKTATVFMSYSVCEELVRKTTGCSSTEDLTLWHHATCGAMTGVVASFILCPMELVKCRLQANAVKHSPSKIAYLAFKQEGVRGLYRGLPGIWTKEIPGSFIYFGSFEMAKSGLRQINESSHLSLRAVFLCGMFAGLCFCVTHPIESVKTRVQVMSAVTSQQSGFLRTFVNIVKTEGVRPLMSGLKPCMVRACLYSGIQFMTYEWAKERFFHMQNNSQ